MKVTLAATQMACTDNYDENIKRADHLVREAKKQGGDVILLQELFERKYFCQIEDYERFSFAEEYKDSKTLDHFSKLAKELKVVLPISFFEKAGNCYFNSLCVIDADGRRVGLYRKTHIPTGQCYEEKFYFTPGDTGFKVFKTKYGKVGAAICWDQWFPETARSLALKGADYLLFPTAIGSEPVLPVDSSSHWLNAMRGHAASNIMPVVASNRISEETDKESNMTFYGSSLILDECGNVLKQASRDKEEILTYQFDLDEIAKKRVSWGVFRDRRPEMYSSLLKNDDGGEE